MRHRRKGCITRCGDIPVYTAEYEVLDEADRLCTDQRNALCYETTCASPTVAEVCQKAHRIAVLENVVNPTNVGAIFRSAAALHMDAVLATPDAAIPCTAVRCAVSMGTVFQVPWTIFPRERKVAGGRYGMSAETGI